MGDAAPLIDWGIALEPPPGRWTLALTSGEFYVLKINGESHHLYRRALLFLQPGDTTEALAPEKLRVTALHFEPAFLCPVLSGALVESEDYPFLCREYHYPPLRCFTKRGLAYAGVLTVPDGMADRIGGLFDAAGRQLSFRPDVYWSCRTRSLLLMLLHMSDFLYSRQMSREGDGTDILQRARGYILAHLHEKITLPELCRCLGVNRMMLNRRFREATGRTVGDYIIEKRVELSLQDLAFTELPLYEIAAKYAFADAAHYTRVFSARMHITPLKYRQAERERRRCACGAGGSRKR